MLKATESTAPTPVVNIAERVAMMQDWSDYLDRLRTGATIIEGKFGRFC